MRMRSQILESLPLLADQALRRHFHLVEEHFGRGMVHHGADRPNRDAMSDRRPEIHEQNRQPLAPFLHLLEGRRPDHEEHEVGVFGA
jgi:hypothetical protein